MVHHERIRTFSRRRLVAGTCTSSSFINESLQVQSRLIDNRAWMPSLYLVHICTYNCNILYAIYNIYMYAEFVFVRIILHGTYMYTMYMYGVLTRYV